MYRRAKYACYLTGVVTAVTGCLSPLLFLTFREMYGISYSLLGTLVLINFCTQLIMDLLFSFFSHRFNLALSVKLTPVVMAAGLVLYIAAPWLFPHAPYAGLALGTVLFSAGNGLAEVLTSPVIAAIPSGNPEREMSRLHSCYAWGVVGVVAFSALFLHFIGDRNWQLLTGILLVIPVAASALFLGADIPPMETPEHASGTAALFRGGDMALCILCIFLGGATECTMSQWCPGYLEQVFGIEKIWGDLFGLALFGAMLGLGRTLYSKYGKNIMRVLLFCSLGALACYAVAVISDIPAVGLLACAFTGFCASMLWPGSLIAAADRIPGGGVAMYALMASGGDLGASVVSQLVGIITDLVIAAPAAAGIASSMNVTLDTLGMKSGMAFACIFPLANAILIAYLSRRWHKK